LLQQAEDLANQSGVASGEDHLKLGNEYEFGRRLEPALSHFKAALAGKDSLMKATERLSSELLIAQGERNILPVDLGFAVQLCEGVLQVAPKVFSLCWNRR